MFNFIRKNLLDVIEWKDDSRDTICYRFPMFVDGKEKEIMMGAQLTVRETQVAVFVSNGQIADIFQPGMHRLSTSNLPILTQIKSWAFGFNSPFKSEVYFINTRQFTDIKWGTSNPVMMRDQDFGVVRLRAFGNFSFRVDDPGTFIKEMVGTNAIFKVSNAEEQLKRQLVSSFSDYMGEIKIPALDIAQNLDEIGTYVKEKVQEKFSKFGIKATDVIIENVSLPKEVEQVIDKKTSMGVLGNLDQYAKYQTAEAIREAANNPNGANFAGIGVGIGAGGAMGTMMGQSLSQKQIFCTSCGQGNPETAKFCSGCGKPLGVISKPVCPSCHNEVVIGAKFCPHCGAKL
jgi:membrane protease subunit (stomatin/prohibitin family)